MKDGLFKKRTKLDINNLIYDDNGAPMLADKAAGGAA